MTFRMRVHTLQNVGGVDHAPDIGGKRKERDDVRPRLPPGPDDHRKALAPGAGLEGRQRGRGRLDRGRGIDRAQGPRHALAIAPAHEIETAANQMDQTGL
jgi:hypothetical protein